MLSPNPNLDNIIKEHVHNQPRKQKRTLCINKLTCFLLTILSFSAICQNNISLDDVSLESNNLIENIGEHRYVSLKDNKVFDVEIIIFAYLNPLPNYKTFKNKPIFDDSQALTLTLKPENLPYIQEKADIEADIDSKKLQNSSPTSTETSQSEFTVALEDNEENKMVLAWFEHQPEKYKLTPIWKKLIQQQTIIPLVHKAWRQPETPFDHPIYVKISNLLIDKTTDKDKIISVDSADINETESLSEDQSQNQEVSLSNIIENTFTQSIHANSDLLYLQNQLVAQENYESENITFFQENIDASEFKPKTYSDFTLTGMLALSQGRFLHFGHKLNLFRLYNQPDSETPIKNMVFSLIERRQTKTDELHYFDSPWLGSIVKITEYTGENENEEADE